MVSRTLVGQHPLLSVMKTDMEKASEQAKLELTPAWSLYWCLQRTSFSGENWTVSKPGFNNRGNGTKDKKENSAESRL